MKGKAAAIVADCKAANPPVSSRTAATTPSRTAQKNRCQSGGVSAPPDASVAFTSEPESDEVTKKVVTRMIASTEVMALNGKLSRKVNKTRGVSPSRTSCSKGSAVPLTACNRAVLP